MESVYQVFTTTVSMKLMDTITCTRRAHFIWFVTTSSLIYPPLPVAWTKPGFTNSGHCLSIFILLFSTIIITYCKRMNQKKLNYTELMLKTVSTLHNRYRSIFYTCLTSIEHYLTKEMLVSRSNNR